MKKKKNSISLLFMNIARTFRLYWLIDKKSLILYSSSVLILAFIPFITSYLWGQTINIIVDMISGKEINTETIYFYFISSSLLTAISAIMWEWNSYINRMSWFNWHEYMAVEVPRKISSLDIEKFEDSKFKNLINKIEQGYSHKPANYVETMIWAIFQLIQVVSSIFILITFSPILLPIILVSLIPSFIVSFKASKLGWGIWDAKGETPRKFWMSSWYLKNDDYVKEIRVYGIQNTLLRSIKSLLSTFQNEQRSIETKT